MLRRFSFSSFTKSIAAKRLYNSFILGKKFHVMAVSYNASSSKVSELFGAPNLPLLIRIFVVGFSNIASIKPFKSL